MNIQKKNERQKDPLVSIILLDWSCRERFHALDWLERQSVARDMYEIIWVELYDRVLPNVLEKTDVHVTLSQKGMYHKHEGYNAGLLCARGSILTVCDSDAVFPENFIESILTRFSVGSDGDLRPLVLMHYQWRSPEVYPDGFDDLSTIGDYPWVELWPNVGACMTVRARDAYGFGGFDESETFRGYMCGPYDLGWRLVNAGIPEVWVEPEESALWHFAHPDPPGTYVGSSKEMKKEIVNDHIDGHALTAVTAFSTGRLLPLAENPEILKRRMEQRAIGTEFEKKYANMPGGAFRKKAALLTAFRFDVKRLAKTILGERIYNWMKKVYYSMKS